MIRVGTVGGTAARPSAGRDERVTAGRRQAQESSVGNQNILLYHKALVASGDCPCEDSNAASLVGVGSD